MKKYRTFSIGLGTVFMLMYIGYGVAFYYGAHLVLVGEATPGTVFTVKSQKTKLHTLHSVPKENIQFLHVKTNGDL